METIDVGVILNNRYKLIKSLGKGGYGEVWLAEDLFLDSQHAIKFYEHTDAEGQNAFRREFMKVRHLHHDNLLIASHVDVFGHRPFLVMEYCPEGTVKRRIGRMSEDEIWHLIHDVAAGLAYMHAQEPAIIHQDIKPDNILIHPNGKYVISDFGISRSVHSSSGANGTFVSAGTTAYMGPERFLASPQTIMASDIWSLGATIHEIATGSQPFIGPDGYGFGGVAFKLGYEMPILPKSFSRDLNAAMQACMARDTWDRPTAQELEDFATSVLRKKPLRPYPWIRKRKKLNWKVLTGIASAAIAVGLLIWLLFIKSPTQQPVPVTDYETPTGLWTGNIVDEQMEGEGELIFYKKDNMGRVSYRGNMAHGNMEGQGVLTCRNGDMQQGSFENGIIVEGEYRLPSKAVYFKGKFKDGQPYDGTWYKIEDNEPLEVIKNGR